MRSYAYKNSCSNLPTANQILLKAAMPDSRSVYDATGLMQSRPGAKSPCRLVRVQRPRGAGGCFAALHRT
jgi:hypothetical protein